MSVVADVFVANTCGIAGDALLIAERKDQQAAGVECRSKFFWYFFIQAPAEHPDDGAGALKQDIEDGTFQLAVECAHHRIFPLGHPRRPIQTRQYGTAPRFAGAEETVCGLVEEGEGAEGGHELFFSAEFIAHAVFDVVVDDEV